MPEHGAGAEEVVREAVQAAIEGELRLLDPEVRRSPELVGALLHPEFHEFGASGRHWNRAAIIDSLAATTTTTATTVTATTATTAEPGSAPAVVSRMRGVRLAPDVVHLTFDTEDNGRHVHRSSLWRRSAEAAGGAAGAAGEEWLMYFHQGTPFDPEAAP